MLPRSMASSPHPAPRWLLLIHQLPPSPAYLRVKTARQLQKVGAVAVKNSVYVLPNTDAANESFAWLSKEIAAGGGEATLCESSFVGGTSNEAIEALFHAARGKDYQELADEIRAALKALGKAPAHRATQASAAESALARFRRRLGGDRRARLLRRARPRSDRRRCSASLEDRLRQPAADAPPPKEASPSPREGGRLGDPQGRPRRSDRQRLADQAVHRPATRS